MTFKELGISKDLIKGLTELNINQPTKIQELVIGHLMQNSGDLIAQAQTGTGKTAAFGLPILERINTKDNKIQAVILSPTRELAQQIKQQIFKFTKYSEKVFTEVVFGGEKIEKQIQNLRRPTHILVATPGRLADLIRRKAVDIRQAKLMVLDEADEMLSMGFKKDLEFILNTMKHQKDIWLFSATIPTDIKYIIKQYLDPNAKQLKASGNELVNEKILHQYVPCDTDEKFMVLDYFLKTQKKERGIIFCNTKNSARSLFEKLKSRKLAVGILEGDMHQKDRDKELRSFKSKKLDLLIATDVAARGIDVANLAYVVHYEIPKQLDYYIHRSGRTARAGKTGISMALCTKNEMVQIKNIQKELGIKMKQVPFG
ncbi:DEAD/DEAH box helicase [Marivirga arenosa]|uniref:DEAD/DEAH box helicase n=1 Tax=Marivirga arenosa TaxID=3059076 RepID=A0AA49GIS6_9BACT|nr:MULTISPECIES: DEAD/DEAH box helicase [unclassified Marivirga]WKK80591.2 DEAD/DEAH box helicase [Marivirga sp. BKB1-2]WKK84426.2 DEAD/DEAH box helicase [Marivirga sp. ABR2-2]